VRWAAAKAFACAPLPVDMVTAGCNEIAASRDEAAIGGMLELLDHGNTPDMPDLAPALLFLLDHPDHHRREKTVRSLAKFRAPNADVERAVLKRLDDESDGVVYNATQYPYQVVPASEVVPRLLALAPRLGFSIWLSVMDRAPFEDLLQLAQ